MTERELAVTKAYSLYGRHDAIIKGFSERSNRTPSNALQFILDQWASEHPAEWQSLSAISDDGYETTAFARAGEVR